MAETMTRAAVKPTVVPQREPSAGRKPGAAAPVVAPVANGPLGMLYSAGPALGLASGVQCKVVVGPPDDPFEREADRVAERVSSGGPVMRISRLPANGLSAAAQRMTQPDEEEEPAQTLSVQRQATEEEEEPAQTLSVQRQATDDEEEEPAQTLSVQRQATDDEEEEPAQTLSVQRQATDDEEEEPAQTLSVQREAVEEKEEEPVQPQSNGQRGHSMATAAAQAIHGRGAGVPLLAGTRASMERSLGVDLGDVRVHATGSAHAAARALHARAFTHRNHIWLGAGESQADLRLMAHETTHVIQQDGVVRRKPVESATGELEERKGASSRSDVSQPAASNADATPPSAEAEKPSVTAPGPPESVAPVSGEAPAAMTANDAPTEAATAVVGQGESKAPPATSGQPSTPPVEGEAAPQRSPATPAEDPDFQRTLGKVRKTRKAQGSHPQPEAKKEEVTVAAVLPEADQKTRNARSDHLVSMEATADATETKEKSTPSFSPETFKELLKSNLAAIEKALPQSEEAAADFKREKPLEEVKQNIGGQVAAENTKVTGPMASQVKQDAPPSEKPVQEAKSLEEEMPGTKPKPISAAAAAPKPMTASEVSMEPESRSLDDKMAQEGITEEQLAESNEPQFVEALDTKRQAQQEAAAAPGRYREKEEKILAGAQSRARSAGQAGFGAMHESRSGAFSGVFATQSSTKTADEAEQKRILGELERIYNGAKTDVETMLNQLSTDVDTTFETEAGAAKSSFEEQVEEKLDDIYGVTVIDDWIFGEDTEAIEEVFRVEKERFLTAMDRTLDKIAELIAAQLNAAIARIKKGRQEAQTFYDGLNKEQQRLAGEAMEVYKAKYDTLEETVTAKQEELAQTLAESYKSNVDSLRESFDKIKEEVSKGWIGKAIDFIVDVATAIKKLGELLLSIISRIANIVGDILAHPIRFLENLASGVAAGFAKFAGNLDTYLISGFFEWLRGSVGGPAIEVPSSFEPSGLFNLVTQVLSLDYQTFRDLAVKKFGEPVVATLEAGADLADEGLMLFRIAQRDGLGALWSHIKEMVASNVSEIFEQVKQTVLYETIEKVLSFVAGLFTPVGAFIRAVQTLYRGLRFLVDNIDRIAELVDAFLSSLELAVQGNVGAIADKVVLALRAFIVVAIDFLAKLVGLGNLGEKVRKILKALRQPIIRAMKWVLNKLSPLVRRIKKGISAVARKGRAAVEAVLDWWRIRQSFKQGGKSHTLYFKGARKNAVLVMHSEQEQEVSNWLVARRESASPAMRPFIEEALRAYARFNVARGNVEALRTELDALPPAAQRARNAEYKTVSRIFAAALRDLGRTFSALPLEVDPERIVLNLPRFKSLALYQSHARGRRLQHSLQRPQRLTRQLQRWDRHVRTEITNQWMDYGRRLGLPEERILRPDWDRRGVTTPMQVDHRIEWQLRPLGDESTLDEPWNYELLDAQSNRTSGASLDRSIRAERQRIASKTGDHSWLGRDLTFTDVEGGGTSGRRWLLEEITNGEHLKVYAERYGEPAASGDLPAAEAVAGARSDQGRTAADLGDQASVETGLRALERRNPAQADRLRSLVSLRLQERSWDDIRTELGISATELKRLRSLLSDAGVRL